MSCRQSEMQQSLAASIDASGTASQIAQAVALHCRHESELIRSQAARALATVGTTDIATELHSLLIDEDPDVRVDAMHALVRCARPEDAPMIRASLIGDPEFDVKKAAVAALAAVKDRGAVDLLCQLAADRCDEHISWDESSHDWDEWLDLQPFIIKALGAIGDDLCVEPLLTLALGEPECESLVFDALMQVGDRGVTKVLAFLDSADNAVRERVVRVVLQCRPELLSLHTDKLLSDDDPRLRIVGMNILNVAPSLIREKTLHDPDVQVRLAGIERLHTAREDDYRTLLAALHDPVATMRLRALELAVQCTAFALETLTEDTREQFINDNQSELLLSARVCLQLMGSSAETQLIIWLASRDTPLERRVYAATVLRQIPSAHTVNALSEALADNAQQVRLVCLKALVDLIPLPDDALMTAKAAPDGVSHDSLRSQVLLILKRTISGEHLSLLLSAAASGDDALTPQPIRWHDGLSTSIQSAVDVDIARETTTGVSELDRHAHTGAQPPLSTLEAIKQASRRPVSVGVSDVTVEAEYQAGVDAQSGVARADDSVQNDSMVDKIRQTKGARRRVSIEGPHDFNHSLRCLALLMCARLPDAGIERATLAALDDTNDEIVESALRALHERYNHIDCLEQHVSGELIGMLMGMTGYEHQGVRYWAASVLFLILDEDVASSTSLINRLIRDEDALCRSLAMQRAKPEQLLQGLTDESSIVRSAVIDRILDDPALLPLDAALDTLEQNHFDDTLRNLIARSAKAKTAVAERLECSGLPSSSLNTLLGALAAA